ncbi:MAG: response regulator transcription factor [Bacteroidales bacterium]|jgi:two-component system alkaline phosphatase synthesis response regulator PhoP|nr:response regulator transcription factor [Bacteroidales bacterium]
MSPRVTHTVLVVEDEEDIQRLVSFNLIKAGFHVICADDGVMGLAKLAQEKIDLIVLDRMMPRMDGISMCKKIRENSSLQGCPVLMLTAKGEDEDVVEGLHAGADDYLSKPFSPKVLIARINALLRRSSSEGPGDFLTFPDFDLNISPQTYDVSQAGRKIGLTKSEFHILLLLAGKPGWVFSRQQIIDDIRGFDYALTDRAIDVQVSG